VASAGATIAAFGVVMLCLQVHLSSVGSVAMAEVVDRGSVKDKNGYPRVYSLLELDGAPVGATCIAPTPLLSPAPLSRENVEVIYRKIDSAFDPLTAFMGDGIAANIRARLGWHASRYQCEVNTVPGRWLLPLLSIAIGLIMFVSLWRGSDSSDLTMP
jgi:hypothetical protein